MKCGVYCDPDTRTHASGCEGLTVEGGELRNNMCPECDRVFADLPKHLWDVHAIGVTAPRDSVAGTIGPLTCPDCKHVLGGLAALQKHREESCVKRAKPAIANTYDWAQEPLNEARDAAIARARANDMVNHPPHYRAHPSGVECITVTEHFDFNLGNAIKYVWRAGEKGSQLEDLKKARWYLDREIARLEKAK